MKNREIFLRDPVTTKLMNNGQARLDDRASLREELQHFVCEGQYGDGLTRIIESFLRHLGGTTQPAAWVSGFYGSGKSHLLKMLGHLWCNTEFPENGDTARTLVPNLPSDLLANLRELEGQGRRLGGLHAAFGSLQSGSSDSARLTVLAVILRSCGLPETYVQAKFVLYLKANNFYDKVDAFVKSKGRSLTREMNDLWVSPVLRDALLTVDPSLGSSEAVRELLKKNFEQPRDIDTPEMLRMIREVLSTNAGLPLTVIVLDEVQQYIADSPSLAGQIPEIAEALCKHMDGRVMLVAAGQNALSAQVDHFGKLRDRFTVVIELSDADVETVTRKVLLAKRPDKIAEVKQILALHSGEIHRELASTSIAPCAADQAFLLEDYPILPARRRFWERVMRAVDPSGTSSLLRAQLRIVHDALHDIAEEEVNTVVPADFMFDQLHVDMVQKGVLLRDLDDRIANLAKNGAEGKLQARLCGLIFLIRKLPRALGSDSGVRATPDMLADLMVSDLSEDGARLRRDVPKILEQLVEAGVLLKDGEEYNLQSRESLEWESEFRARQTEVLANESLVTQRRSEILQNMLQSELNVVRPVQGESKTPRQIRYCFDSEKPEPSTEEVLVWVRDGWSCVDREIIESARASGAEGATVFVYIQRASADELRKLLVRAEAAKKTIEYKGVPATREGQEALSAMSTRQAEATGKSLELIKQLIAGAKVFKSGGAEVLNSTLVERVKEAVNDSLSRLFPRFKDADHRGWTQVQTRAKGDDDSPLRVVDFAGPSEQHPVCAEILKLIGPGKKGSEIIRLLSESPYGWPQDAIAGGLLALVRSGHLSVRYNGSAIQLPQLDQTRIKSADFRIEAVTLSTQDKLAVAGLLQAAGMAVRDKNDLAAKVDEYIAKLRALVAQAGGEAPLPERPKAALLDEIERAAGNDRLKKLLANKEELEALQSQWRKSAELIEKRRPIWATLTALLDAGRTVEEIGPCAAQAKSIEESRLLIEGDHLTPLKKQTAGIVRAKLKSLLDEYQKVLSKFQHELAVEPQWEKLAAERRTVLLRSTGLTEFKAPDISSDEALLAVLRETSLDTLTARIAALPELFRRLKELVAKEFEPRVQTVKLRSTTIRTEAELKTWSREQEEELLKKLKDGPILIC